MLSSIREKISSLFTPQVRMTLKKIFINVFCLYKFREYWMLNIIYITLLVLIIIMMFQVWDMRHLKQTFTLGGILFLILRGFMELVSYGTRKLIGSPQTLVSSVEQISVNLVWWEDTQKFTQKWGVSIIIFLACVGIIGSFFIPMLVIDGSTSESYMHLIGNALDMGSDSLLNAMTQILWQSILAGISILIAHTTRGKWLSVVGIFGIWFYARIIMSIFSHSDSISNIFDIFRHFGVHADEILSVAFSSPWFLLYMISSLILIFGCFGIIGGYVRLLSTINS